jgi:photosystem II stability/assembly factor-like uncharacterized protein
MPALASWSRRALRALMLVVVVSGCGGDGGGDEEPPPTASPTPTATIAPTPLPSDTPTPSPAATPVPAVAWATGSQLLRSDDGGFTWTATGLGLVHAVSFADQSVGWVVSGTVPGIVLRTGDGGATWIPQGSHIVGAPPVLNDVVAADTMHVFAVGQEARDLPLPPGPAVLFTEDGGRAWRRALLPPLDAALANVELRTVCVAPTGAGLATGTDFVGFEASLVLVTRDGGRSWQDATTRVPRGLDAAAACDTSGRLWFLGPRSTVRVSADGGTTWEDRQGDLPGSLRVQRGAFLGGGLGWIATSSGVSEGHLRVFRTRDDGATWEPRLDVDGLGELTLGFDAIDDRSAVVVAQDARPLQLPRSSFGRSWATHDGGATWTAVEHPPPVDALWDVDLVP